MPEKRSRRDRDLTAIEGGLKQLERRYVPAMDRQLQEYWLNEYLKLPAGQRVAAACVARGAKFQLEMGGKNPFVVLDDADLDVAVAAAVNSGFFSTGLGGFGITTSYTTALKH